MPVRLILGAGGLASTLALLALTLLVLAYGRLAGGIERAATAAGFVETGTASG